MMAPQKTKSAPVSAATSSSRRSFDGDQTSSSSSSATQPPRASPRPVFQADAWPLGSSWRSTRNLGHSSDASRDVTGVRDPSSTTITSAATSACPRALSSVLGNQSPRSRVGMIVVTSVLADSIGLATRTIISSALPQGQPEVSVVIPTLNRWDELARRGLRAALGQQGVSLEVVVVDDGSDTRPSKSTPFEDP